MKKTISFDFDNTLDHPYIQDYALELKSRGFHIIVCTSRYEPGFVHEGKWIEWSSEDIFQICEILGITDTNFTNMRDKYLYLKDREDLLFHLDDDNIEIIMLEDNNMKAVLLDADWKENCEKIIRETEKME